MSLSQLSGKQGINYAKLRHKKSPNDQQSFGLFEDINRDNLMYIQSLIRKPNNDVKHQRAKSTLENKQNSYRHGTPHNELDELEGDKLFDQFFKLNNSKSESDFVVQSQPGDFAKFLDNAIDYHKSNEVKFFKPTANRQLEQKLKEATISNRLLANELNRYKQKEQDMKNKMKLLQKEFSIQYTQLVQKCQWLEELLAKQKIDNENSLLAVKKTVEMLSTKCKCQKGVQLYDKILRDVKNQERYYDETKQTHSSSELSNNDTEEMQEFNNYKYFEQKQRKSLSKTEEHQSEQLSFIKNRMPKEIFMRKKQQFQDPYYIEEENTINST